MVWLHFWLGERGQSKVFEAWRARNHVFYEAFEAPEPWVFDAWEARNLVCGLGAFRARKSLPGGLREASGGSPEAPQAGRRPPGTPGGHFRTHLGAFEGRKSSILVLKLNRKSSSDLDRYFGASGGLRGPFWGRFGGNLGVVFVPPGAWCDFSKK